MKRFPNVFTVLLLILLFYNYFSPFGDLDWTWQVRTGGEILKTGSLRPPETFSYTINGVVIPDFEWLYEVVLNLVWTTFGIGGLKFLRIILVVLPLLILMRHLQREKVRWHGIAIALIAALFILRPAWNLRPYFVSTICLTFVASALHDHCRGRRPLPWWLPLLMLLWGNMHPGVITGQGLLVGAIGWEWLNCWLKFNPPLNSAALKRLTIVGGVSLAATAICADPVERLRYVFKPELADPIMRVFVEMQPLYTFVSIPPFSTAPVYLVAALVLMTIVWRPRSYRGWELALLAGTTALGNFAYRAMPDWLFVMLLLGTPRMRDMVVEFATRRLRRPTWLLRTDLTFKRIFRTPLFRWQPEWQVTAIGGLLLVSLFPPLARGMPVQDGKDWPVGALDYIEKEGLSGNFFAPPDYGAYIGWRIGSRGLVYTDTRGFFFPPKLLEDCNYIPQLDSDWRKRLTRVLDDYHTDYFLLETESFRGQLWELLKPKVQPLYVDDKAVLLTAAQVREAVRVLPVDH